MRQSQRQTVIVNLQTPTTRRKRRTRKQKPRTMYGQAIQALELARVRRMTNSIQYNDVGASLARAAERDVSRRSLNDSNVTTESRMFDYGPKDGVLRYSPSAPQTPSTSAQASPAQTPVQNTAGRAAVLRDLGGRRVTFEQSPAMSPILPNDSTMTPIPVINEDNDRLTPSQRSTLKARDEQLQREREALPRRNERLRQEEAVRTLNVRNIDSVQRLRGGTRSGRPFHNRDLQTANVEGHGELPRTPGPDSNVRTMIDAINAREAQNPTALSTPQRLS